VNKNGTNAPPRLLLATPPFTATPAASKQAFHPWP